MRTKLTAATGLLLAVGAMAACGPSRSDPDQTSADSPPSRVAPAAAEKLPPKPSGDTKMTIEISSTAFAHGQPIPKKYTGEGTDVSPALAWSKLPDGTQELALICDDPDAPTDEPWVHWVIYKIPADTKGLPEAVARNPKLDAPAGAMQGKNGWPSGENIGYRGPMPPVGHGTHHYHFTLYALKAKLEVAPGLDKKALLAKMSGMVLASGRLTGTYKR